MSMEKEPLDFIQENNYYQKPSLLTRIQSVMIDSFVILLLMMVLSFLLEKFGIASGHIRGAALITVSLYEPIMVTFGQTLGQKMMGLQVNYFDTLGKPYSEKGVDLLASLIRYFTKLLLGWVSLLTIQSDTYGQVIHDKVSGSVMVFED